jgi:hypothetical protein
VFAIIYLTFLLNPVISAFANKKGKQNISIKEINNKIGPNVGDIIQNLQHPLYEREYLPTEVQSLAAILPKPKNIYEMTSAEILGDPKRGTDLDQVFIFIN